jgi:hypothetical protein
VRGDRRRFLPRVGAEQLGHREVDHSQPGVGAEHEFGRSELGVHQTGTVAGVERATRFEAHDQRLRRLQEAPAVEQIAQAAATQVLDDPEHGRLAVELGPTPSEHAGDVGVRQGHRRVDVAAEVVPERRVQREFGTHDLEGDGDVVSGVGRLGDDRGGAGRDDVLDAVAAGHHETFEGFAFRVGAVRHVVVHSHATLPPEQVASVAGIMEW